MELANLTATGKKVNIKDREEIIYPLRFLDWGYIEQWMRTRMLEAACETINALPAKSAEIVMKSAHITAAQISIINCLRGSSEDTHVLAYLRSFEGMLQTIWRALRVSEQSDAKPKYSIQEVDAMFESDLVSLHQIFGEVLNLSFPMLEEQVKNLKLTEQPKG